MNDLSNPARFSFPSVRASVDTGRVEDTRPGNTPPAAFASLAATQRHLEEMLGKAKPTIVIGSKVLPASEGFKPVMTFRHT